MDFFLRCGYWGCLQQAYKEYLGVGGKGEFWVSLEQVGDGGFAVSKYRANGNIYTFVSEVEAQINPDGPTILALSC